MPIVATLVGCAASSPSLTIDGYERIAIPTGCYRQMNSGEHDILLDAHLEQRLLSLLPQETTAARCWHERKDGTLALTIGDACGPHQEGVFERLGKLSVNQARPVELWSLKDFKDVPIVLCHERNQRTHAT